MQSDAGYVLGLDLGTNSVGWGLVQLSTGGTIELDALGVRVFPEAGSDNVQKGKRELKNQERRQARSQRRTLARRRMRRQRLYDLLASAGVIPVDPTERNSWLCAHVVDGAPFHPYALRAQAAQTPIAPQSFARALCHLNQRRGYLSTRDLMAADIPERYLRLVEETLEADAAQKDDETAERGVVLGSIAAAKSELAARKLSTYGQLMWDLMKDGYAARNYKDAAVKAKSKTPLQLRPSRQMLQDEFETMWDVQSKANPILWTEALKNHVREAIFYQRPLKDVQDRRLSCTLFPSKKRSARAGYAFQRARIIQDLVQLSVAGRESKGLTAGEIELVLPPLMQGYDLPYDAIATLAKLPEKSVSTTRKGSKATANVVKGFRTLALFRDVLGDSLDAMGESGARKLVEAYVCGTSPSARYQRFRKMELSESDAARLALLQAPEGYGDYSTKALNDLTALMIDEGLQQKQALDRFKKLREQAVNGRTFDDVPSPTRQVDRLQIPEGWNLRNPIVERSLKETVWVVNQIVRRYGVPKAIHLEMPRDLSAPAALKYEIYKRQLDKRKERERVAKWLREQGVEPTDTLIKKVRLADECNWVLPYEAWTPHAKIELHDLVSGEIEIDHVVPRSHTWDNGWDNLLLCRRSVNLKKGDRTPYEFFTATSASDWDRFAIHIKSLKKISPRKRERILRETRPEPGFLNSQLTNTGYLSKAARALLGELGCDVVCTKGAMTADLRKAWRLNGLLTDWDAEAVRAKATKKDKSAEGDLGASGGLEILKSRDDHRHHAIDAVVVALTSRSVGLRLTKLFQGLKDPYARVDLRPSCPISNLREKLAERLDDLPIVYANDRRPRGMLHKATALKPDPETPPPSKAASIMHGGKLVRFDHEGRPAQSYALENNHHVTIYQSIVPDKNGECAIVARVVPMLEAVTRYRSGRPVFGGDQVPPGFERAFSFCQNDIVEWTGDSPGLYRVAKFSSLKDAVYLEIQALYLARAFPDLVNVPIKTKRGEPISVRLRITGRAGLKRLARRVILNAFGEIVHSEANLAHSP